jgi:ribonuclease P protein component
VERLRRRTEFKAVASGKRVARPGFVLQALKAGAARPARIGFTVTKKTGNAVERNRIRRRLKAAVAGCHNLETATDYVLVGRRAALTLPFERLVTDLESGFAALSREPQP